MTIIFLVPGLYFTLSGTVYQSGDTIPITGVGDSFLPDDFILHQGFTKR